MTRESDWTIKEFAVLVASAEIDAEELSGSDLQSRSSGAIGVARAGIKLYANGEDTKGILSRMMVEFLEKRPSLAQWAAHQPH